METEVWISEKKHEYRSQNLEPWTIIVRDWALIKVLGAYAQLYFRIAKIECLFPLPHLSG